MSSYDLLRDRAVRLLALRDHSELELVRKLRKHGSSAEIDQLVTELRFRGYLDDEKFARARATYLRATKRAGNKRIAADLQTHGVDGTIIRLVLDHLEDEAPEAESLREAVRARVTKAGRPNSLKDLKKLFDYAIRLGYPPGAVREALEPFFSNLGADE